MFLTENRRKEPKSEAFRMLGPLRQDSNLARDMHDWFNLLALLPVIYLNLRNWCCRGPGWLRPLMA